MSIGLALSGGGAKGIAHIGVIEALKDYGIKIDYIAGTSCGSIIAALYASGYTPNEMLKIINANKDKIIDIDKNVGFKIFGSMISKKVSIKGFIKGNSLEKMLRQILKYKGVEDISDVEFPLAIPTVDLNTGEIVYFWNKENDRACLIEDNVNYDDEPSYYTKGDLASIIRASCSVPGVFMPKKIDDACYVDGGVRVNTPVEVLRKMGADKVIAVTFDCNKRPTFSIENVVGISTQAFNIMTHSSNMDEIASADVNVHLCLHNVSLLDVSKATYTAKRGYNIVARNILKIKEMIGIK
ncbi:MAG: patatin-like phospholipase family protein [Clostridia bacterium]|nr:patatin-like phospholipase family protein [Clostridia bacterium]